MGIQCNLCEPNTLTKIWPTCSSPSTKILVVSWILNHFPKIRMLTSSENAPAFITGKKTDLRGRRSSVEPQTWRLTPFRHVFCWSVLIKKTQNYNIKIGISLFFGCFFYQDILETFFYQDRDFAGCCQFFGRPGFDGLGLIPEAPGCVSPVRMHWSDRGAAGMLRHAPVSRRLPNASVQATRTPEILESILTRQIPACQKIGNFGYLDKKNNSIWWGDRKNDPNSTKNISTLVTFVIFDFTAPGMRFLASPALIFGSGKNPKKN